MKTPLPLRLFAAGLCGLVSSVFLILLPIKPAQAQNIPSAGLVFTGLRAASAAYKFDAQFNAVHSDASGNLYLLLDQKDGIRLLKTDPTATDVLAQIQRGASGDIGLAMTLELSGSVSSPEPQHPAHSSQPSPTPPTLPSTRLSASSIRT
jgi:hypothetical protein